METSLPALAPEREKGYAYDIYGFRVSGILRESSARLKAKLGPTVIGTAATVNTKWILAQLKHYGIKPNRNADRIEVEALLRKSVYGGLCDTVPQPILDIESSFRQSFEPRKREHELKCKEHRVLERAQIAREFAALGTPSEEAAYRMHMFLRKYFLDDNGNSDKTKTPAPIALPGFANRSQVHAAAERTPGLESVSGGYGDDRTVVIGWDRSAVWKVAAQIESPSIARINAAEKAEWDRLMQQHRAFVQNSAKSASGAGFSIADGKGEYIVKCDALVSASNQANRMRLRITKGPQGWVGIFEFDVLEGIMLLGESLMDVASRVRTKAGKKKYGSDSSNSADQKPEEDQDSSEDQDSEEDQSCEEDQGSEEVTYSSATVSKKRKARSTDRPSRPNKHQKQTKSPTRKIHLQWRGTESGEGEIQLDPNNKHVGYLEFLDNSGMTFKGTASFGFLENKIRFHGYKIGTSGGLASRSWGDYSMAAYEEARFRRWR